MEELLSLPSILCRNVCKLVDEEPVVELPPIAETRLWKSDCKLLRSVVWVEVVPLLVLLLLSRACITS